MLCHFDFYFRVNENWPDMMCGASVTMNTDLNPMPFRPVKAVQNIESERTKLPHYNIALAGNMASLCPINLFVGQGEMCIRRVHLPIQLVAVLELAPRLQMARTSGSVKPHSLLTRVTAPAVTRMDTHGVTPAAYVLSSEFCKSSEKKCTLFVYKSLLSFSSARP